MPGRKRIKSDGAKKVQRKRTHENKVRRYEKLIMGGGTSAQLEAWNKKLDYSKAKIS